MSVTQAQCSCGFQECFETTVSLLYVLLLQPFAAIDSFVACDPGKISPLENTESLHSRLFYDEIIDCKV